MNQAARLLLLKTSFLVMGLLAIALVFGARISSAAIPERRAQTSPSVERPDSVFALALQDYDGGQIGRAHV